MPDEFPDVISVIGLHEMFEDVGEDVSAVMLHAVCAMVEELPSKVEEAAGHLEAIFRVAEVSGGFGREEQDGL